MTHDLGSGRQVIVSKGRLLLWANRGCLGVELDPKQMQEIGLAMWLIGRRAQRSE